MSDSGWLRDEEDFDFLHSLPSEDSLLPLVGQYVEIALDPRSVMRVENQGRQGACAGHSLSSVVEWCGAIATGSRFAELSRAMAYYESQRIAGISGDRGTTISSTIRLSRDVGICEESLWAYPASYNPRRPANWQSIVDSSAKHKLASFTQLRTYEGIRTFLGSGQGGIQCGIGWSSSMSGAIVETYRPGGGGHAIALLCLSERKDRSGQPYVWMKNSWGQAWGSREFPGWQEWSPTAIRQMLSSSWSEFVGCSDMPEAKPRKFSLEEWQRGLRV